MKYLSFTVALDCIVGDWGPWSQPNVYGVCDRKRPIIRYPTNNGKDCPPLKQTKIGENGTHPPLGVAAALIRFSDCDVACKGKFTH